MKKKIYLIFSIVLACLIIHFVWHTLNFHADFGTFMDEPTIRNCQVTIEENNKFPLLTMSALLIVAAITNIIIIFKLSKKHA